MSTIRRNRTPAKPRPPQRYVRWIEKPSAEFDGWGALMLQTDGRAGVYLVKRLQAIDFGQAAFQLLPLDKDLNETGQVYDVLIEGPSAGRCDCLGWLKHGHCKHVDGLVALLRCTAFDLGDHPVRVPHPKPSEEEYRQAMGQAPMYWSVKVEQRHDSSWCLAGYYHFDHQKVEASTADDLLVLMRLADKEREQKRAAAATGHEERGYSLMRVAGAPDDRHEVKHFGTATGCFVLRKAGETTWRLYRTVRNRAVEQTTRANNLAEVIGLLFPARVSICKPAEVPPPPKPPAPAPNPPTSAGWWLAPATRLSDGSEEISVRFADRGAGGRLHRRLSSPDWRVLVGWGPETKELGTVRDPAEAIRLHADRFRAWLPNGRPVSNYTGD